MSQNVFWQNWVATTNVKVTVRARTIIDSLIFVSLFVAQLSVVVGHHEPECLLTELGCYHQCQGHSEGSYNHWFINFVLCPLFAYNLQVCLSPLFSFPCFFVCIQLTSVSVTFVLFPLLLCLHTTYKCVCHLLHPESRCWRSNWTSCRPWSRASWPPRPVWWPHSTTAPTNSTCRKLLRKPGCWYGSCRSKRKLCCAAWTGAGPSTRLCPSSNSFKSRVRMLWTLSTLWLVSGIVTSFTHFQAYHWLFNK